MMEGVNENVSQGLHLSTDLGLPRNAVTHVTGILAMRGSGKSYAASVLMEEMVQQGLFVGFIDPLGIAWGIRSSADGEQEGLPVLILGGRHGDVPLNPSAGAVVARALVEMRQPFILDLSLFEDDEQQTFVADFLQALKAFEQVLLHLIVDEADIFAPQIAQSKAAQRSLAAMNALARRYRVKGIGATFITQRPAVLNKSVMQFDLLLALRMTLDHDISAVDAWVKTVASKEQRATFLSTLPALATGTAWAWSPQWLHVFQQIRVRTRHTFDSSQTPDVDVLVREPKRRAEIDLTHLSAQLTACIDQATETDPVLLRQRIQSLEQELAQVRATSHGKRQEHAKNEDTTVSQLRAELAQTRQQLAAKGQDIQRLQQQLAAFTQHQVKVAGTGATVSLAEVPTYLQRLHIEQATISIDQLNGVPHTRASREKERGPSEPAPTPKVPAKKPLTVNDALALLPHSQGITLKNLMKKVEALTSNERALFSWLLSNDGSGIRPLDLADAVCINVRATRPDRTAALRSIPFIQHPANTGSSFVSTFAAYTVKAFPGASGEAMNLVKECLLKAAQED